MKGKEPHQTYASKRHLEIRIATLCILDDCGTSNKSQTVEVWWCKNKA